MIKGAYLAKHIDGRMTGGNVITDVGGDMARQVYWQISVAEEMFAKEESVKHIASALMYRITDDFKQYIDQRAQGEKKRFHHIYEWGQVGNPEGRLFQTRIWKSKEGATTRIIFLTSKTPNPDGHIFAQKAEWMESGLPATVTPINAPLLVFPKRDEQGNPIMGANGTPELIFAKKTVIINPGGVETTRSLQRSFKAYWNSGKPKQVMADSKIINQLLREIRGRAPKGKSGSVKANAKAKGAAAVRRVK